MALISSHQRETFVFLWLSLAAKPNLEFPFSSFHQLSHFTNSFRSSLNFKISTVPSEDVCLKVFVTKSWRIYEIVQKYNFHLCGLFATRDWGRQHVCMGIQHSSESRGQYLLRRAELGSLLKSGVLLDPSLLLRVMNFTSALNPTERYIYWVPSPLHV